MSTPLLRPHVRPSAVRSALAGALLLTLAVSPGVLFADTTIPTFVPIGAGYEADTLKQFAAEAATVDDSGVVSILVLPIAYGVDPLSMSNGLRKTNLTLADNRRSQIEAACLAVIPSGDTCKVVLAPVLVRADAFLETNLDLVTDGLDGIFVLGGDQDVAMEVVNNTPFEDGARPRPGRRCGDQREQCRRGGRIGRHDRRLHRRQRTRAGPRAGFGRRLDLLGADRYHARPGLRSPGRPARPARLPARPDRAPDQRIVRGRASSASASTPTRRRRSGMAPI